MVKDTTNAPLKSEIEKLETKLTALERGVKEGRTEYVQTIAEEASVNKMIEFYSA